MGNVFFGGGKVGMKTPSLVDAFTVLLLHGDSLKDSGINNVAITNRGVEVSTTQSKFGGKSLYFNGSSNLTFTLPVDCFAGTQDWTVEWWEYRLGTNTSSAVFYKPLSNSVCGMILCDDNGQGTLTMYESSNGSSHNVASGLKLGSTLLNQWVHRAIVKASGVYTAYENGVKVNSLTYSSNIPTSSYPMCIGYYGIAMFYGYINEFRISNTARWTEAFTPPTESY